MKLEFAATTHSGRVRQRNEDALAVREECGLAILADGMGGYNAGDVASRIAVAVIGDTLAAALAQGGEPPRVRRAARLLEEAIDAANRAVLDKALSDPACNGMGTTIVATLFVDGCIVAAHAGDSRLYRWRASNLALLTRDHSVTQDHIDAGLITPEEARVSVNRGLITRALGVAPGMKADIASHRVEAGDMYLLCSDGLSDMVDDHEISTAFATGLPPDRLASGLVDMANARGGCDNISVLLARVVTCAPPARPSLLDRLLGRG